MKTSNHIEDAPKTESVERYLSLREACEFLSVSAGFFYKYSRQIPHLMVGGRKSGKNLYLASELRTWAESQRVVSPPKATP